MPRLNWKQELDIRRIILEMQTALNVYQIAQTEGANTQTALNMAFQKHKEGLLFPKDARVAINTWEAGQREHHRSKVELIKAYYRLVNHCGMDLDCGCLNNI